MLANAYMNHRIKRRASEKHKKLQRFCHQNSFNNLQDMPVSQIRKTDTVFILGSGASITEITQEQWQCIKLHDTIGFNNWTMHPFIPNFYFFEPTNTKNETQKRISNILYSNFSNRMSDYANTAVTFIYLEKFFYDMEILNNFKQLSGNKLYFSSPVNLPGDTEKELILAYKQANTMGMFSRIGDTVYRRGSVARIIHFAVAAGYKNIVLMGVDLNTSPYFYDVPGFEIHPGANKIWYTSEKPKDKVHTTVDPSVHPVTMLDVLRILNEQVLVPNGIQLKNGAKSSALMGQLDYYWND